MITLRMATCAGKISDMEHEMESLLKRHAEEKEALINHYDAKCDVSSQRFRVALSIVS